MTTYLIVGNGVAGNSAAETIRRNDPTGKILIFSKEKHYFCYTPALPEYLWGEKQVKDFIVHDAQWYEKHRINLFLETEITQIDFQKKIALTPKGAKFSYDQLLLACGGKSFLPSDSRLFLPGVSRPPNHCGRGCHSQEAPRGEESRRDRRWASGIGGGQWPSKSGTGGLGGGVFSPAPAQTDGR